MNTETTTTLPKVALYNQQGGSDKVYQVEILLTDGGYVVNFAYGRRGSTLVPGTKTAKPVDYLQAEKIYSKLVNEKKAKGYQPGSDGTSYVAASDDERQTDTFCQLLNKVAEEDIERLITDDGWGGQEKFDGKRMIITATGETVAAVNRLAKTCGLPKPVEEAAKAIQKVVGDFVMDGEVIGDRFFVFDLLEVSVSEQKDLRELAYERRYTALKVIQQLTADLFKMQTAGDAPFILAELALTEEEKRAMYARLRKGRKEGMVFKRLSAPSRPGRPNKGGDQLKCKFWETATCLVVKQNGQQRSVALSVQTREGTYNHVSIGNCTIPANFEIPTGGELVEIRYLYFRPGGCLYQPIYQGIRDDKTEADDISTLKCKAGTDHEA